MEREEAYLSATYRGVLEVVEPNGTLGIYIQRGVKKIPAKHKIILKQMGILVQNVEEYKEFPSNYTLINEVPEIMGKVTASFPYKYYVKKYNLT